MVCSWRRGGAVALVVAGPAGRSLRRVCVVRLGRAACRPARLAAPLSGGRVVLLPAGVVIPVGRQLARRRRPRVPALPAAAQYGVTPRSVVGLEEHQGAALTHDPPAERSQSALRHGRARLAGTLLDGAGGLRQRRVAVPQHARHAYGGGPQVGRRELEVECAVQPSHLTAPAGRLSSQVAGRRPPAQVPQRRPAPAEVGPTGEALDGRHVDHVLDPVVLMLLGRAVDRLAQHGRRLFRRLGARQHLVIASVQQWRRRTDPLGRHALAAPRARRVELGRGGVSTAVVLPLGRRPPLHRVARRLVRAAEFAQEARAAGVAELAGLDERCDALSVGRVHPEAVPDGGGDEAARSARVGRRDGVVQRRVAGPVGARHGAVDGGETHVDERRPPVNGGVVQRVEAAPVVPAHLRPALEQVARDADAPRLLPDQRAVDERRPAVAVALVHVAAEHDEEANLVEVALFDGRVDVRLHAHVGSAWRRHLAALCRPHISTGTYSFSRLLCIGDLWCLQ